MSDSGARDYSKYLEWIANEFAPLELATPEETLCQLLENAIRYWNTNSAYKISQVYAYPSATKRVQISNEFKVVAQVYPTLTTTYIWNDHPLWTLMGITVLDNVTSDLILMSEAFRNYRQYVGTDFRWMYEKSADPDVGGYLYAVNVPAGCSSLFCVGTKRILQAEDIKNEYILDWIYRYWKSLVKQVEGNTLRKGAIVGVVTDGQVLVDEGKEEAAELKEELQINGRWLTFALRH
jgi:hypothetical protein